MSLEEEEVVGTSRFELLTCRLGGDRSIQLSYVPTNRHTMILAVGGATFRNMAKAK